MKNLTSLPSILALFLFVLMPVSAADIIVDENCSLDDAIKAANNDRATGGCPAGDGADVITLTADVRLQSALPLVKSHLTIEGDDHTITGNRRTHIFGVQRDGILTLNRLTITGGRSGWGGAIGNLGGKLTINESVIRSNSADEGGAIGNEGILVVANSVIRNNNAEGKGGAIYNLGGLVTVTSTKLITNSSDGSGGAVFNDDGSVTIKEYSVLSQNTAELSGGAIYNDEGTVQVSKSSFLSNQAGERYSRSGGAIYNTIIWDDKEDKLTISRSVFRNNSATKHGGAIYNCCGDLTITNSTFISNTATENGGAINNENDYDTTTITNSTIYGNSAGEDGGGIYLESGDAEVKLLYNIIAGSKQGGDCFGRLTVNTKNLIGDGSCYAELSGDPMIGELIVPEDGSPAYLPLSEDSPAVDSTERPRCSPNVDQIGTARPQGESCDIGAIEYVQDE